MRNSPLACSYAVPTSKLLIHRLNMTLRCHGDRYFHKILSKIGYCGLDPRIIPLCAVGRVKVVGQGEPQARRVVALGAPVTSITVHMILYGVSFC